MTEPILEILESMIRRALIEPEKRLTLGDDIRSCIEGVDADTGIWRVVRDLAWDLEFYVPEPVRRSEDASYYGDDRIVEELQRALSCFARPPDAEAE